MRRVTIFDDTIGLEMTLTFDDGSSGTVITSLTLATPDGSGVRSEHFKQLEQYGLTIPTPSRKRTAMTPDASGASETGTGDGGTVPGQSAPPSPPRGTVHRRPPEKEFRAAWKRCEGSIKRLAQIFDVPYKTASNWVYAARKSGVLPTQTPAPPVESEYIDAP
jgi:hypothetical protein